MHAQNIKDYEDNLETLLLMMLEGNAEQGEGAIVEGIGDRAREYVDMTKFLRFRPCYPQSAYTFDATDEDRLIAASADYLCDHPAEILGDRTEICMIASDSVKWSAFIRRQRPRHIVPAGRCAVFYEMHHMQGDIKNGWNSYGCRAVGFDSKGRTVLFRAKGLKGFTSPKDAQNAIIAASIKEDAERSDAFTAEVEFDRSIRFPVGVQAYQDFFRLRDGYRDTQTGRKNPILHWCSEHLREKQNGGMTQVKGHMRGTDSIEVDGMKLVLTPPSSWE